MSGEDVRQILIINGYSLKEVADNLKISPQLLQNWLNVSDIKVGRLEMIAKAINESVYYFIDIIYKGNRKASTEVNEPSPSYDKACPECKYKERIIEQLQKENERLWKLVETKKRQEQWDSCQLKVIYKKQ